MLITRLATNPIIHRDLFVPGDPDGANINGPCLVRVPDWVPSPLGRYYCYFAHHQGTSIRLAYADALAGPWQLHSGGVLSLADIPAVKGHIASPDVIWDDATKECRIYLHAPARAVPGQQTFLVCGGDGLHFPTVGTEPLTPPYLRVWRHDGWCYGLVKGGRLYRSRDGRTDFIKGHNPFSLPPESEAGTTLAGIRHLAIVPGPDAILVYWSSIGDTPERILRAGMDIRGDWSTWQAGPPEEVLRSELPWEGSDLPVVTSRSGAVHHPEHALRDPHVFTDNDGRQWLTYSTAGEQAIAIAEIQDAAR